MAGRPASQAGERFATSLTVHGNRLLEGHTAAGDTVRDRSTRRISRTKAVRQSSDENRKHRRESECVPVPGLRGRRRRLTRHVTTFFYDSNAHHLSYSMLEHQHLIINLRPSSSNNRRRFTSCCAHSPGPVAEVSAWPRDKHPGIGPARRRSPGRLNCHRAPLSRAHVHAVPAHTHC